MGSSVEVGRASLSLDCPRLVVGHPVGLKGIRDAISFGGIREQTVTWGDDGFGLLGSERYDAMNGIGRTDFIGQFAKSGFPICMPWFQHRGGSFDLVALLGEDVDETHADIRICLNIPNALG